MQKNLIQGFFLRNKKAYSFSAFDILKLGNCRFGAFLGAVSFLRSVDLE